MSQQQTEHILQFFKYDHLKPSLQEVSKPFRDAAHLLVQQVPRNPEREVSLRKLLEAKDAAVRAAMADGAEWDAFAHRWVIPGKHTGPAITPNTTGA